MDLYFIKFKDLTAHNFIIIFVHKINELTGWV